MDPVTYIHIVKATAIAFSVYYHDIPPDIKSSSNNNYDSPLIGGYIDSIQYKNLVERPCLNFHFCSLGLVLNVKNYSVRCGIYDNETLLGNTKSSILRAPCGKIHIQHATEVPVNYTWIIQAAKNLKINTTVLKIDVPYETLNCSYNYLHIININENHKAWVEGNARLCGRAFGKIFYSNTSIIRITLALRYVKYDTVLSLLYQVHSNLRILVAEFQKKISRLDSIPESGLDYDVQQLFVMADNRIMDIYFYNTYILNKISIVIQNNRCSENRALVYDGPNSRSKLLGESQRNPDGRDTFNSSVSIISIYLLGSPLKTCFNITAYIYSVKQQATRQYEEAFKTTFKRSYGLEAENIFEHIEISVPIPYFINIKMNRFIYTGYTEAGCYLGGIVILNDNWPPIGPLCGEVGRLIFEDKRLDGVTLNSNKASLIIFLYSGQSSKLLLDIIFSSDKCQGIQNLRDYYPVHHKYADRELQRGMFMIHRKFTYSDYVLYFDKTSPIAKCLKVQNFIDSVITNTRRIRTELFMTGNLANRVNALIQMVRHEGPCGAFNVSPYSVTWWEYAFAYHQLSTMNITYISKSLFLQNILYSIFTLHDITCAPIYDGVSEIIFHILEERCDRITFQKLQNNESFEPLIFATPTCSSTTVDFSDGIYGRVFNWITGYPINIQVSISHELQHCTEREIYIVIKLLIIKFTPTRKLIMSATSIWKMEQDRFEWEYPADLIFSNRLELFISVKRHRRNNVELYPNISSCNQTMLIEHQSKKVHDPHPQHFYDRDYEHCLLSTCYTLYPFRTNVSWNGAQTLCQQDGMQLLTINSDIKAQFIENILHVYVYLYFARHPLLFLNMKQDDKVYAIVK